MKKIFVLLILIGIGIVGFGQSLLKQGVKIGNTSRITKIDSINSTNEKFYIYKSDTLLYPYGVVRGDVDSSKIINTTDAAFYDGVDTLNPYTPFINRDIGVELADTLNSDGIYYTQRQVDSLYALINSFAASRMQFIIDTTSLAPITGDSIFTQSSFINKHLEIYRGNAGGTLYKQYRNPTGALQIYHDGYRFQKSTGQIIFKPVFATNEHVVIEITDSTLWTSIEPTYCPEYLAVYNAMTTKPSAATALKQNTMVKSLVNKGYWSRLYQLLIFATEYNTAGEALINWKNPGTYDATANHSISWTAYQGYIGDNGNDEIDANFNPTGITAQNSATYGIYIRNNATDAQPVIWADDVNDVSLLVRNSSNIASAKINGTLTTDVDTVTTSAGLWVMTRRGATDIELYRNATTIDAEADVSAGVPNVEVRIFYLTPYQGSIYFCINAISDAESTELKTIFETYMDAIGTGVIP